MQININKAANKFRGLPIHFQVLISALPSVILLIFAVFVIFLPKNEELDALQTKSADLGKKITISESKIKKLDELIKENAMLKRELARLKEQLPEEREVSELLKQISELSLQSGLKVLLWKPGPRITDPQGLYVEIPVDVEVLAEYHRLGDFFSHISRLPRLVNISDIHLKGKEGESKGIINAKFTARTFASVKQSDIAPAGAQGK
jgi:type IV pilus assembly protein PilO